MGFVGRILARLLGLIVVDHGLLFLLVLYQFPGGLRIARAGAKQHGAQAGRRHQRYAARVRQRRTYGHQCPPSCDRPRKTARKPEPAVTISRAGSSVSTMTPVLFPVNLPR